MSKIKFIRQFQYMAGVSILYDVVYTSGRICFYANRDELPKTAEAFLRSADISYQYDNTYKYIEYIYSKEATI